jgi:hypothetical protein
MPGQEVHSLMPELETKSLPESAYERLKPGESYPPIVAADVRLPELTVRSVGWGIFLCIIFTIAAAYSGTRCRPSLFAWPADVWAFCS